MSGSASRSQFSRFDKRRLMLLMLKLAIFISGSTMRHDCAAFHNQAWLAVAGYSMPISRGTK